MSILEAVTSFCLLLFPEQLEPFRALRRNPRSSHRMNKRTNEEKATAEQVKTIILGFLKLRLLFILFLMTGGQNAAF